MYCLEIKCRWPKVFDDVHCESNGWSPAFYQTGPDNLPIFTEAGFDSLCIGHEAIVDVRNFSLSGNSKQSIRTALNKLNKNGFPWAGSTRVTFGRVSS
ncbi:MAG: DUF2156 domain-containing protein [Spirochaetales bacterium]|nr:MAG: DUF2156 domain-containing protein [Spirochaetales bacterium]